MKRPVLLYFLLLLFVYCNHAPETVLDRVNSIQGGDFRGVFIRSSLEEVKSIEKAIPKNEESDYLFYEISLGENNGTLTLGYSFNEKGLYEILADIFPKNSEESLQLFQQIKEDFQKRFGSPQQEDDRTVVWTVKTEHSDEVEITLIDESENYGSGKISISFYDLTY